MRAEGERRVDRDAWARVVDQLVLTHNRGNKSAFARQAGVDVRTVTRWLAGTVDVSEESVRGVARAFSLKPRELLVELGVYQRDELLPEATAEDEEVALILTADVDDETKRKMIDRLMELRERDKQRRMDDIRWALERGERGA